MERPNILFLFPDQWRWDFLGCGEEGIPVRTPHLDALARRGVRFTQCRTNAPVCAPARACLVEGLRFERAGVPHNNVSTDPGARTYMKQLQAVGYHTAGCGKFDLFKPEHFRGLEGWTDNLGEIGFTRAYDQSGKFDCATNGWPEPQDFYSSYLHEQGLMRTHVEDYRRRKENRESGACGAWPTPLPREAHTDEFTTRNALRLLDELPGDAPWYLWVNFPGPHDPFDPPEEIYRRYAAVDFPPPVNPDPSADPDEVLHQRRSYAACCEHIDELCGRILAKVEERGELEHTVIVFCSDHGEMLGDHGRWNKQVPQEGSVRVPLIVAGPGVEASGAVNNAPVELIDLAETITDCAGADAIPGWDSRSLKPVLEDPRRAHRTVTLSALNDWRSACDGRAKLILRNGVPEALYDLRDDPREEQNRLGSTPESAWRHLLDALRS